MKSDKTEADLKEIINRINRSEIASIRSVVSGIMDIINNPESTAKDLQDIIEIDPPLVSKVIKTANSAYYSPRNPIGRIEEAIIWIGFDALKELALNQKICEIFYSNKSIGEYSRISLWMHSVAVAILCKMIYRREFGEKGDDIYVAGLLHEIGIIIEDQFLTSRFKDILSNTGPGKMSFIDAEHEILAFDHCGIGQALIKRWKFPQELVAAIGSHHYPEYAPEEFSRMVKTLFVADFICRQKSIGYIDMETDNDSVFQNCLKELSIEPFALDLIIEDLELELSKLNDQGLFN